LQTGLNQGTWKVVAVTGATTLTLQRDDGGSFVAESGVQWSLIVGTKITVLPGTYSSFAVPAAVNDLDLEGWGAGSDVVISDVSSPLISVEGSRCRLSGFRLEGTGIGIEIDGRDNVFEKHRFSPSLTGRYSVGVGAVGNRVLDAAENSDKSCFTVSPHPSRGDFVGASEVAIQAAVDAAAADPQLKRVFLGAGSYTLSATVVIPSGITVFGAGYGTVVAGDGTFPLFTLNAGGNQTV
jgi:hypothetical protein